MPFKSKAQRRFMYAKHPGIAARWSAHTPTGAKLPERVKKAAGGIVEGGLKTLSDLSAYLRYFRGGERPRVLQAMNYAPKLPEQFPPEVIAQALYDGPVAAYNPAKFERLAFPLHELQGGAEALSPREDQRINALSKIKHYSSMPFLSFQELPPVARNTFPPEYQDMIATRRHEGRHRSRAMARRGDTGSLMQLRGGDDLFRNLDDLMLNQIISEGYRPPTSPNDPTWSLFQPVRAGSVFHTTPFAGGGLVQMLRKLPRDERWEALTEHPLKRTEGKHAMFGEMRKKDSPIAFHGGVPDFMVKNPQWVPKSRTRWFAYDTERPNKEGTATELGTIASNIGKRGVPIDLIDIKLDEALRGEGYGTDILASLMSTLKDENTKFPLYDVQGYARKYWENLGAQMQDPSKPFRVKTKPAYDKQGWFDAERSVMRNNDYFLLPGEFLEGLDRKRYADGGEVDKNDGDGGILGGLTAAAIAAGYMHPATRRLVKRAVNASVRPVQRARTPVTASFETATTGKETPASSIYRKARVEGGLDIPSSRLEQGQGAWMGERGMEFNPVYMRSMRPNLGPVTGNEDAMQYAAGMGAGLDQAAVPVARAMPSLFNIPEGADALIAQGMSPDRLQRLATRMGPETVVAQRPDAEALLFSLSGEAPEKMMKRAQDSLPGLAARYGVSRPGYDRALLTKERVDWGDETYDAVMARKRQKKAKGGLACACEAMGKRR